MCGKLTHAHLPVVLGPSNCRENKKTARNYISINSIGMVSVRLQMGLTHI